MPFPDALPGILEHDSYVARYDAEIAYADYAFGRVLDVLEELSVLDTTLVVFTADHGEALGERGQYYLHHEPYVYDEVLRLPLIIAGPGVPAGRSERLVQSVDVMPTVLEMLDIPVPELLKDGTQGTSFSAALRGEEDV